jgi:small subunit ribosomal protein S21
MIPVNMGANFGNSEDSVTNSPGVVAEKSDFAVGISVFRKLAYICAPKGGIINMLIIDSKDCENIDKALKKYKKKFEKAKVLVQLRERQSYTKPSVKRRGEVLKAIYKQQVAAGKYE